MAKRRTAMGWARRGLAAALVALVAACAYGWSWERSEQRAFTALELEPPGEWVQVGTHRLHVIALGEGSPGVLFVTGLGDDWRSFREIAGPLSDSTRVVMYDRPGLGWSPPSDDARTVDAAVDDIRQLLANGEIFDAPPILVGHSLGGAIARQVALRYPSRVAGLILLDPTPVHAMPTWMTAVGSVVYRLQAWSGAMGLTRWRLYRASTGRSREQRMHSAFLNASGARSNGVLREFRGAVGSERVEPLRGALGEIPLTLLAAPTPMPPGLARATEKMDAAKRSLAEESDLGRFVETQTGHYVHFDDPEAVVAEVLEMLGRLR